MNENEKRELAAQLRQPSGTTGLEIADLMNKGNGQMNRHSLAVLAPEEGDRILEVGMGNGHFIQEIIAHRENIRYTGCDFSELMIEEAAKRNRSQIEKGCVDFWLGKAEELPFDDNSFNKILTINTLYFWDDPSLTLRSFKRVLQPEGRLIIAIRPREIMQHYPFIQYGFTMYSPDELSDLLLSNGFGNLEITSIKEPPQVRNGELFNVGCLIVSAKPQ